MNTTTEKTIETPEELSGLVPTKPCREFEVCVRLKKSSKYYDQGLGANGAPRYFKLESFSPQCVPGLICDGYFLHFNNNTYRTEDCEFYLVDPTDRKRFVRIL